MTAVWNPWRKTAATAGAVVVVVAVAGGFGWAIVAGHGKCAALVAVTAAVAAAVTAPPVAAYTTRVVTERCAAEALNASKEPTDRYGAAPSSMPRSIGPRRMC